MSIIIIHIGPPIQYNILYSTLRYSFIMSQASELGILHLTISSKTSSWHLIGQHKLCNLVFTFYQTNKEILKSMSREHLLLLKLSMLHSNFSGQNLQLASHRATQASHASFHILQDNSSTTKVHIKKAPHWGQGPICLLIKC
jgi:hypothetical protein